MKSKRIAIVGSAEANPAADKGYEPPLRNAEVAKKAAEEIGRKLAEEGYELLVYSGDPKYIEGDFVRGYCASGKARRHSIVVKTPFSGGPKFVEQANDKE